MIRKMKLSTSPKQKLVRSSRGVFGHLATFAAVLFLALGIHAIFTPTENTSAADLSKFSAGNIMSDEVMSDYNSMSVSQIQSFLKSKNSCNNTNVGAAKNYPHLSYHIKDGHFVCMADETFDGQSAAQIIYDAAHKYKINPKVIIVLLQKEQGLVTDTWPNDRQYRTATGYGCPDTAPCDSKYYGLKNQIERASELFRTVLDGGWTNYPVGNNYIRWSPNSSCGGSTVYIQNRATSALYRYTPYQPNKAALNAGYGTGDSCSAYGNRNFYAYYTDWFGDTHSNGITVGTDELPSSNYNVASKLNTDYLLDVVNGSTSSSVPLQTYKKNNTNNQNWRFSYNSDGSYTIINEKSGKAIDLSGGNAKNGASVQQYTPNGTCAQKWYIMKEGDYYYFASACNRNYAIDVTDGKVTNYPHLQVWEHGSGGNSNQLWKLSDRITSVSASELPDATYNVSTKINTGYLLDVVNGSNDSGVRLQTYKKNNTNNQNWRFTRNSDGSYTIINEKSNKAIDLNNASASNGSAVQQYTSNNTCAQKWFVVKENGYYYFASACNKNYAIDIPDGNVTNYPHLQAWEHNAGNNNQLWKVEKKITTSTNNTATPVKPDELPSSNYNVASKLNTDYLLDVVNGSTSSSVPLQTYKKNNTNNQNWRFSYNSDGSYTIINEKSGKAIDLSGGNAKNGASVQQYTPNGTCAQKWYIMKEGDYYYFASACNRNYAIDVTDGKVTNYPHLQVWEHGSGGNSNQLWKLSDRITSVSASELPDATYNVSTKINTGYLLDVVNGSNDSGVRLQTYKKNNTNNQNWRFTRNSDGSYTIINEKSNKAIDLNNASASNGSAVQQYTSNNTCAQKWFVVKENGYYYFASACNKNYAIDIPDGNVTNYPHLQAWEHNAGNNNQLWKIEKK